MQARALGEFLRTRRELVSPDAVGFPGTAGRRVSGLRREEVAVLAGIGVSWLTRLEQGAASGVSTDVLDALATALQLDEAERAHLHHLAGFGHSPGHSADAPSLIGDDHRHSQLVDALAPSPAYILDVRWRLAAWNQPLTDLVPPLVHHRAGSSLLEVFLTDPAVRDIVVDWETQARRLITQFRSHAAEFPGPATERVSDSLSATSELFRQVWQAQDVDRFQTTTRAFVVDGAVKEFAQHRLALVDRPGWTLTVFLPGPDGR